MAFSGAQMEIEPRVIWSGSAFIVETVFTPLETLRGDIFVANQWSLVGGTLLSRPIEKHGSWHVRVVRFGVVPANDNMWTRFPEFWMPLLKHCEERGLLCSFYYNWRFWNWNLVRSGRVTFSWWRSPAKRAVLREEEQYLLCALGQLTALILGADWGKATVEP
jgi:hypothetical protein